MRQIQKEKKDITDIDDIRLLVNTFYFRASKDELLSPIFGTRMPEAHLDPLYRYWQTILLQQETYLGAPFPKHADLPLTHQHFDRWLSLFQDTVDELFTGPVAETAKFRAIKMSEDFRFKMELTIF